MSNRVYKGVALSPKGLIMTTVKVKRGVVFFPLVLIVLFGSVPAYAALQTGTSQQLSDFPGAPKGSLYGSADSALLGGCGPGAKEFLKKKSSNPSSIDGLKPSFACALQKLIQSNPGVTIGVGTYKTTANPATADCSRVQCRTGANANGGTHEKGCAADLLYNGQKGPIGPAGIPWCRSNQLCNAVHQKASGFGLQFRLMPGHPGFPGTAEVWHVETQGARAGHCPESASGEGGGGGAGAPSSNQPQGGESSGSGSGGSSGGAPSSAPKITPEDLEHEQIEKDPSILKGSSVLAEQAGAIFEDTVSDTPANASGQADTSHNSNPNAPANSNLVQSFLEASSTSETPLSDMTSPTLWDRFTGALRWTQETFGVSSSAPVPYGGGWISHVPVGNAIANWLRF